MNASAASTTDSVNIPARQTYQSRFDAAEHELVGLQAIHRRMIWLRTGLFLLAAVGLVLGYFGDQYRIALLVAGWTAAAGFLAAIVYDERLRLLKIQHQSQKNLCQRLIARLDRDWDKIPEQSLLPEFQELNFADDLDVAGRASLLGLLSLAGTLPGRRTLQRWIAEPPAWSEVERRQAAVKLLRDERDLRLSIIQTVIASSDGTEDVYGLPRWTASPFWLVHHRVAHALSFIGPATLLVGVIGFVASLQFETSIWQNIFAYSAAAGILINVLVTIFWGSWIHDIFQQVTGQHRAVFQFADVFSSFSRLPPDNGMLDRIRSVATEDKTCATQGFAKLLWWVRLANLQRDPTMYVVYLVLQLVTVWDFRILSRLENWKREFGPHVEEWFEQLGICEALVCSSTLADEYRDWQFPTALPSKDAKISAVRLGHPLLPDTARVRNDLQLASDRPLLLVTGSNMAGKSTFMRALGLNLLLARTGSPVCAEQLATPLYDLATSIRVRDSLRDGVSFFMAELKRLKEVVDLAEHRDPEKDPPILFLLDEILQGTNSNERQIAVASVLNKLLSFNACGLVSTHDLDLASAPDIESVSQVVHFREFFENQDGQEVMRFDYQMRPGATPTTNALKLLKLVGLHTTSTDQSKSD